MPHTFIILDGHPNAFSPTHRAESATAPPTHQLPPIPLWACMVQSTIDFCRIAWDIEQTKKNIISVMVAGTVPTILNDSTEQTVEILQQNISQAQPRNNSPKDRLLPTLERALAKYLEMEQTDTLPRCRIVLLSIVKQTNEKPFEYRNNPEDSCRDLRAIIHEALANVQAKHPLKSLSHVQMDVLRLLPYCESAEYQVPPKIVSRQISSSITMSIYNIPNGSEDLKVAMRNLCQLYYNINVLHISNIPMKSAENTVYTHTVTLYYQANGYHLINQQEPFQNSYIHEPKYLKYREMKLVYSKRSKRGLPESEWCTCMHSISPIKLYDVATEVFLDMTSKGSISYLVTPETPSKAWTHILMAQEGGIFLHCLNSQLQNQFQQVESESIQVPQYNTGSNPKAQELMESMIRPNLFQNINDFLSNAISNPLCKIVPLNPFRYSHHLPIMTMNEKGLCTSRFIEKSTRWRTCFRDCEGTDRFPITENTGRAVSDLATDVLNGVAVSSGFGIAFGLIHDLLEQLQDVFLKDEIPKKDMGKTEQLIDMIISQLFNGITGESQKMFLKGLRKADAKLLSKKLTVGLYLVGKRFIKDSPSHEKLCSYMLSTIDEKYQAQAQFEEEDAVNSADIVKSEDNYNIDVAWNQVNRYENMSLREREDAAQGYLPDFKQDEGIKNEPMNFGGQFPPKSSASSVKINPNFKSRRATTTQPSLAASNEKPRQPYNRPNAMQPWQLQAPQKTKFPDPSNAVPYLTFIAPTLEEKAEEEEHEEKLLGEPGNLLWLYWMNDKVKKRGNIEEGDLSSGTELVYRNQKWKRVKKEFLGRTAQPGEKGEL